MSSPKLPSPPIDPTIPHFELHISLVLLTLIFTISYLHIHIYLSTSFSAFACFKLCFLCLVIYDLITHSYVVK